MLRIFVIITGFLLIIYSCNNNISTIGQDLINNNNHIGEDNIIVTNIGTIKVDSFIVSSGEYSTSYINKLVMGKYVDTIYAGTTVAIPCFQVVPYVLPNISYSAVLDSVTLQFRYGGNMWGDTLYNIQPQRFKLYQLESLPKLNYDNNTLFYNTHPVELGDEIGSTSFLPLARSMAESYFRIDDNLGEDLFHRLVYRQDNDIYQPSSGPVPYISFLDYFKGLAIVPDEANNCLMTIHALSDSLYMEFHYSESGTSKIIRFPLGQREYQYNRIVTTPVEKLAVLNESQKNEVTSEEAGFTIVQGLSGYMIKMQLPQPPGYPEYSTIIRAELELKPDIFYNIPISLPKSVNVYTTNDLNELTGVLTDKSGNTITGSLVLDETSLQNSKYVFNLTEYYQNLSTAPPLARDPQILLSIPNDGLSSSGISFDRMILLETPKIKIHYANYN